MSRRLIELLLLVLAGIACIPHSALGQGAVGALRTLLESGRVPAERQGAIIEMICTRGEADDLAVVYRMVDKPGAMSPDVKRRVLDLLADAAVTRKVKPTGDLSALAKLIEGEEAAKDQRMQVAAIRLAAAWKLAEVAPTLHGIAKSDKASESLQQAALDGLVAMGGPASRQTIAEISISGRSVRVRVLAIAALARIDSAAAANAAADVLSKVGTQDDIGPMLDALLGRKDGADRLGAALTARPPPADAAKLALRHIYSVGRSDQALSDVLSKAAGIALDAPPPAQEEVAKIAALVSAKGDAARGERIFRRSDLSCMKCHAVAQAGGSVGPDLSPVGSISPVDYIVNSILNPSLAIKEQFVTRRVLTVDGEVFTGIQIDRDEQRLRLRDAAGKVVAIPTANVDQEGEGKSLMPQGLTKFLTEQELLDLAKFISELGKPGPYAIRKVPSIQRWRVMKTPGPELTSESPNVEIFREHVLDTPDDAWTTAYGMVGGALPLAELAQERPTVLYLQGQLDVNQAGLIAIDVASSERAQIWLDAEPFENAKRIERDLAAGRHSITLRIEVSTTPEPMLKVELTKPEGSQAQFVAVGGM